MAEHAPKFENKEVSEIHAVHHEVHHHAEKHPHKQTEHADKASPEKLVELREKAHSEAVETSLKDFEEPVDNEPTIIGAHQSLKADAYVQTLQTVQKKLSKPVKLFSQFNHNRIVDAASDIGAKTVARPSGILGGSICAFIGSLIVFYSAKHYGFKYNYSLFFILFIGGFLAGAVLELLIWLFYWRKRSN